jgi:hypothetical protein
VFIERSAVLFILPYKLVNALVADHRNAPKKIHPDAFLRNYLKCPVCGGSITGGPSTGNGGTYYYYNCCKDGKHFKCRADAAINKFVDFSAGLKPNKVFYVIDKQYR